MKFLIGRTLSQVDRGLLLTWLLTFPAVTPFLQSTLPQTADGLLHLYRIVALDQALQAGALFPRWMPDLAFGYGLPLFVFYAPLAYYLTDIPHLLGLDIVIAFNLSSVVATWLAATGVYLLVKDFGGPLAGIVAAAAYGYAPYTLANALFRGSLPAVWAAAMFPLVFWAFQRLYRTGRRRYFVLSALLGAMALITHNITGLLFFPLLLFFLACLVVTDMVLQGPSSRHPKMRSGVVPHLRMLHAANRKELSRRLLPVSLALGFTVGLAAFFWLPAMSEKAFVQIERVITPPDFDYRAHFVTLSDLFSWPPPANTGLLNPEFPLTLGLVQVGLAFMLLVPALRVGTAVGSRVRGTAVFALISLLVLIFMMMPVSVPVWDRLPLIAFVQHPSRLQGLTALLLAILAGLGIAMLPDRIRLWATAGSIGLIFISAVPLLYPRYHSSLPAPATLSGMMAYEQSIGAIGTTSFGEYLPIWVRQTPRESPLLPMYQRQAPIERLDPGYLPAGATVEQADYGLNHAEIVLSAPEPHQVIFNTFYFPGWQARVDGQPAPVAPVTERGLIGVTVPAGLHRLSLSFTETPVRRLANAVSLLSLFGLIGLALAWNRIFDPVPHPPSTVYRLPPTTGLMLTLLGLALILGKMLYFDTVHNPLKQDFATTGITGASETRHINFGNQLNFLGYDLPQTHLAAGQTFTLTGYWQARQRLNTDYSLLAQLVDEEQHLYAGQDNLHPGNRPTSQWEPWGFVKDPHSVTVPPGTPPGDYFLITGPYDPANWGRLPVLDPPARQWVDVAAIPVRVERPDRPPSLQALAIAWPPSPQAKAAFSQIEEIKYLGASPEQAALVRNDFFRLALFWEAVTRPSQDYRVQLRLLDEAGEPLLEQISQPSHSRYPTTRWSPSERVRDNHALWIAPDVPAGRYRLQLRLLAEDETPLTEWIEVGQGN